MHVVLKEDNFANDYKKESCNKSILIIYIKEPLSHIQKKFLIFKMKNSKTLKIQKIKLFHILNFQKLFTTSKCGIMYMIKKL